MRIATSAVSRLLPQSRPSCLRVSSSFLQPSQAATVMAASKHTGADRVKGVQESVWVEFIQLAADYKPLNLGQGFPDFAAPPQVSQALADATLSPNVLLNQYTRGFGHPRLVQAIATLYSRLNNRTIDAKSEVLVTIGAYEALFCAIMAHVNPGEEVIVMEPAFDCYEPMTRLAGGSVAFVPLRRPQSSANATSILSSDWKLDIAELESKFNNKTKMIVINTPHNPIGKVFSREELEAIGALCEKYDVLMLMDEVYEWLVFEPLQHVRVASMPRFWDRTITVGSAGKTFSVTGWKLGWAYGPQHLLRPMQLMHQNTIYVCPTPVQEAVAVGFETELARLGANDSYWKDLARMLKGKRDRMAASLISAGMSPTIPEGGYFMLADFSRIAERVDLSGEKDATRDYRFVKWLTKTKGLQGIPPSAFYGPEDKHLAEDLIRFCFIKQDETLDKADRILSDLKTSLSKL